MLTRRVALSAGQGRRHATAAVAKASVVFVPCQPPLNCWVKPDSGPNCAVPNCAVPNWPDGLVPV
jgi:hypothetical protein